MKKLVIVAGDKSADIYGGLLCKHLKEKNPGLKIYSFGGKNIAKNSTQIIDLVNHSTGGLIEVLSSLKKILKIFKQTIQEIKTINPDLIILMDFPDFNLRLAKALNKKYPIFYYISPQIWAWRQGRIKIIKKYVDTMIVIFKFEQDFYRKHNIDALYFGHPMLEVIKPNPVEIKKIISFLPGSRRTEIKYHLPIMQKTKEILSKEFSDYQFRIIRPENIPIDFYQQFNSDMEVIDHSYERLKESKFIVTSSGTATVEIALLGVPFLIIYKMNSLTWHILKRIVHTKFIGMVNILADKQIVEELLQNNATPEIITNRVSSYLNDINSYQKTKQDLEIISTILTPYGATKNFADYIYKYFAGIKINSK